MKCPNCNSRKKPSEIHTSVVVISNRGKVKSIEYDDVNDIFYYMCDDCGEQWSSEVQQDESQ